MTQPTAPETLIKEIESDAKALRKSIIMYKENRIDLTTHMMHQNNLIPRMKEFLTALEVLKDYEL